MQKAVLCILLALLCPGSCGWKEEQAAGWWDQDQPEGQETEGEEHGHKADEIYGCRGRRVYNSEVRHGYIDDQGNFVREYSCINSFGTAAFMVEHDTAGSFSSY